MCVPAHVCMCVPAHVCLHVYVCLPVCVRECTNMCRCLRRPEEGSDLLELDFRQLWSILKVLGNKLRFYPRSACAQNLSAISPAPQEKRLSEERKEVSAPCVLLSLPIILENKQRSMTNKAQECIYAVLRCKVLQILKSNKICMSKPSTQ